MKKKGESYFKIRVTDETCFKENIKPTLTLKEGKVTPKEGDANEERKLIKIKDKKADIIYYPQLLLDQCIYKRFIDKVIFHPDLEFTDTEPESESESESEEEINESTVLDE